MGTERISTLEVRRRLGDILNRVALRHDQFVIERKGKALAAVVPIAKFEQLEALARRYVLSVLEAHRGGPLTDAEANAIANEARRWARRGANRRR